MIRYIDCRGSISFSSKRLYVWQQGRAGDYENEKRSGKRIAGRTFFFLSLFILFYFSLLLRRGVLVVCWLVVCADPMFSESTEIMEAGICGVKNVLLLSHPRPLWHIRFSLPLLSKRIKTLSSNCVSCTPILHSNLYMWLLLSLFTCETDIKHTGWPAWGRRGRERKIEEKKRMQQSSLYTTSATGLLVIYRSLLFLYKIFFFFFLFFLSCCWCLIHTLAGVIRNSTATSSHLLSPAV